MLLWSLIYCINLTLLVYKTETVSLSTVVLNSRDRQGMYGMQHFRVPRNPPYKRV